ELLLPDLDVGAKLQRFKPRRLAGVSAIQLSERVIVLLLIDEKMNQPGARPGIIGINCEIVAVGASGFGFLLRFEALRKPYHRSRSIRLNLQGVPELALSLGRLVIAERRLG